MCLVIIKNALKSFPISCLEKVPEEEVRIIRSQTKFYCILFVIVVE